MKQMKRLATQNIFSSRSVFKDYAYHAGGRTEIQFNIGIERFNDIEELRHGVAFSLETSKSYPDIVEKLTPKIRLFNDFIQLYSNMYADMRMWHYTWGRKKEEAKRSPDYMPTIISHKLVTNHVFIFLGKRQPCERINYELILGDFDRLLPLYNYIESEGCLPPVSSIGTDSFEFRPGCTVKAAYTAATQSQREIDINLRHNVLQQTLYQHLANEHGADNVRTEQPSGVGTMVDVVVRIGAEYWFYEIKTFQSPRACIREALGQLLEYSFWPGAQRASRLIVVGETSLDDEGKRYLQTLKERFSLPIEYEQIVV